MKNERYSAEIMRKTNQCHAVATQARAKGFDPSPTVEIPIARNMAERVEGLISSVAPQIIGSGITERIQELEKQFGTLDWRISLVIAEEIATGKFGQFNDEIQRIEIGIRVGFAYLTLGTVSSPLEGFTRLKLRKTRNNEQYFALHYSGPVRSAGGTGAAVSVLIADYVRKKLGYASYDPNEEEVQRAITEVYDYHDRVTNLQYLPSEEELAFLMRNVPVQIDGDPSEKIEVSNYKDLERVETNKIRNGPCLVLGECLAQKAPKLWKQLSKWGTEFDLEQWDFLKEFIGLQKNVKAKGTAKEEQGIRPDFTFISDLVAGRPILTHPLRHGGFRLRYGRARSTGMSSNAIHPATMTILDNYLAVGTQLKTERPGKSTALSCCDTIEGPIVLLSDGSVKRIEHQNEAAAIKGQIKEILFLGDMLITYGDFFNRAHVLVPPGYCEEWWAQELEEKRAADSTERFSENDTEITREQLNEIITNPLTTNVSAAVAVALSNKFNVALHPRYTYHWNALSVDQLKTLISYLIRSTIEQEPPKIVLPLETEAKRLLEVVGLPHSVIAREFVVVEKEDAHALIETFDLSNITSETVEKEAKRAKTAVDLVDNISTFPIKDKSGTFIGARMGRPEKAKMRKMTGSPQVLFPVGEEGGKMRSLQSALEKRTIRAELPLYRCTACGHDTIFSVCEKCEKKTQKIFYCKFCGGMDTEICARHGRDPQGNKIKNQTFQKQTINIKEIFDTILAKLNTKTYPDLIKGVRGTSNEDHIPEHLMKGILRAQQGICVNKDGTTRYDMTQLGITHFKPKEIGTDIEILKHLGYDRDIHGNTITNALQTIELKPQDVILPSCTASTEEGADAILYRVACFIDDLLVNLYGLDPHYRLQRESDLVGHLVLALAPHTSAAIVGRIIGFSETQGFYAHPLFHAAQRRDLDGDESCVVLLMDALLNFSRKFLPAHRGATQDACLVLTSRLVLGEVDDMVFDVDIGWKYPRDFYEAALQYKHPWNVKIEQIADRINTEQETNNYGFTHDVTNINHGATCSAYKTLPSMEEKLKGQMYLAEKIRAVDEADVARLVIEKHFLRDTRGNLRKFSTQQFRCVACNEKFRRPPLVGKCTNCNGKLIFTVSEGFVLKYLQPSISLAEKYDVSNYLKQTLTLTKRMVEGIFGKEKEQQKLLGDWFK